MTDSITVELHKDDVVRMVCGSSIPSSGIPMVTKLVGNQHNQQWEWDREALKSLTIDELMQVYALINWSAPPVVEQPRIIVP